MSHLLRQPARRRALRQLAGMTLTGALFGPRLARAQLGDKPIRFVLPNATASGVDTITRAAQPALSKALGHPIVVENQPGAGGIIGISTLVKSPPDGYTLSIVSNNHVIYPSVYKSVPFDPIGDITPIAIIGTTPVVLVVNPSKLPVKDVPELVAMLKSKPGVYNYGSSGNGTILHLATELFVQEAGVSAKHVPYKGVGPMLTDLLGGQVDFGTLSLPSIQQHLKSGGLRAVGVTGATRTKAAPEIPTVAEQGMPNYIVDAWFAVIGPKGLPAAEVKRVHDGFVTAFRSPDVVDAMNKQGNIINISTPEYAAQFFRSELAKYAKIVKAAGLEPQ